MYLLMHRLAAWWSSEEGLADPADAQTVGRSQNDLRSHHHVVLGRAPPTQRFESLSRLPIELQPVLRCSSSHISMGARLTIVTSETQVQSLGSRKAGRAAYSRGRSLTSTTCHPRCGE